MEVKRMTGTPLLHNIKNNLQINSENDQSIIRPEYKQSNYEAMNNTEEVQTVVSKMNEFIEPLRTNLKFVFHDELNEYYVTIVHPKTNEVIKEIPPKKMLDMYAAMAELMGFFIDEKI